MQKLFVGTRGSTQALARTSQALAMLRNIAPQFIYEPRIIRTRGDRDERLPVGESEAPLVEDLEISLQNGLIDLAIHHLKDFPANPMKGLVLAAVPFRLDSRDGYISPRYPNLRSLPDGAHIATSGLRRRAQLLALNPTWSFSELTGSIERRILRLQDRSIDAIVVACASLDILNYGSLITERLPYQVMMPAAAQGAAVFECREDDQLLRSILGHLDDPNIRAEVTAERAFYRAMLGGYRIPTGVHSWMQGERLFIEGVLLTPDGSNRCYESLEGPPFAAEALGVRLSRRLWSLGGENVVEASRV